MASTRVVVNLPDAQSYDIRIGNGLLETVGKDARTLNTFEKALVITDTNVGKHYLSPVKTSLARAGYQVVDITIPPGEDSKQIDCVSEIWEAMAQSGFSRDSLIVALGGGVVGDIAGFVASTFMRGVDVIQVPTTLLAMVDSSVGGKTGINLAQGKNLVGAFKQPRFVFASTDTLASLSEDDWVGGCAEIIKSAIIDSDSFFFWLIENASALAWREEAVVIEAITRSVVFKADVVAADTREEKGIRECLNYGHTLGHAIESCAGYGTFSHGQAVAEGMRFAARLGAELVETPTDLISTQDELLDTLGLSSLDWSADADTLLDLMLRDKKVRNGKLRFVLPRDVGDWQLVEVEADTVREHLKAWERAKG